MNEFITLLDFGLYYNSRIKSKKNSDVIISQWRHWWYPIILVFIQNSYGTSIFGWTYSILKHKCLRDSSKSYELDRNFLYISKIEYLLQKYISSSMDFEF